MSANDGTVIALKAPTNVTRVSDLELVITRLVAGSARLVFEAWAQPDLFRQWWAPASIGMAIHSYEADVRSGGHYRVEITHPAAPGPMAFYGRYIEVVPGERIVWTNEEGEGEGPVTSVTFEDRGGATLVTVRDRYPSKEALDQAIAEGSTSGWDEQLGQLEALVVDRLAT